MAPVMTDTQTGHPEKRTGLINYNDWLKLETGAEARAEAARLAEEPSQKKSKKSVTRIEATTIVTGRPSTNNGHDGNDLISYAEPPSPVKVDLCGKNWVGLLTEYYQAHVSHPSPTYTESSPSLNLYTCLITLSELPAGSSPLGDTTKIFNRKKDAKQYAAKLAIEWLVANGHMPPDGGVSFPKSKPSHPLNSGTSSSDPANGNANEDVSAGQRVVALCTSLSLCPPTYKLLQHPEFKAMYSGYAVFENGPLVVGKVGEFANVYGRKKAREACAEGVAQFLEGVVRDRKRRRTEGIEGERKAGDLPDL